MDYSLPGSSLHVILQARIPEWVAISYLAGNMNYRDEKWKWDRRAQDVIGGWSRREVELVFNYVEMGNLKFSEQGVCVLED